MLLFVVAVLILSIPPVQTWLAQKATHYVNNKYDTDISIEKIGLDYAGNVNAKKVFIKDSKADTLILADRLSTSIISFKEIYKGNAALRNAILDGVFVKMQAYPDTELDNFHTFLAKFTPKVKKETKKPFVLSIGDVSVTNSNYLYINKKIKKEGSIVDLKNIKIEARDFKMIGDKVDFHVNSCSGLYNSHIDIIDFANQFHYETGNISIKEINLKTRNKSVLKGDFSMLYKEGDMSDFSNKVVLNANINKSVLATSDVRLFYKEFGKYRFFKITTGFKGVLNDFKLINLKMSGLQKSIIRGNLRLQNSMSQNKIEDFKVSGYLSNLSFTRKDLSGLLPNVVGIYLPEKLDKFETITAIGKVTATPSKVDFKGGVFSALGNASTQILLDNLLSKDQVNYDGNIAVEGFNLGALFENKKMGLATFNLDIDGYGFKLKDLNTYLSGKIDNVYYNGYTYTDIALTGKLKYPIFDGNVISKDPNFDLNFDGVINLNETENDYNFKAAVYNIDFQKLNLFTRDSISIFKGIVTAKFKGTNLDNTYGGIQFQNTTYTNQNEVYNFKDFQMSSVFLEDMQRVVKFNSPEIIEGEVSGVFKVKNIKDLFQNSLASLYKNYEAVVVTENEFLNFDLKIYNKIVDVFFPDIKVGANTNIKGSVANNGAKFNLDFKSPHISYKKNRFENINLKIDNSSPNNTLLSIDKLKTEKYSLSEFVLANINRNDTLYSTSTFKGGEGYKDDFNLKLYHTINKFNNSIIGIEKSTAKLNGNTWYINQDNDKHHKIEFDNNFKDVFIDSIQINHNNERIALNGVLKDSTYKNVTLRFNNVDLKKISKSIPNLDYTGVVNGDLNFVQKDKAYLPTSNLSISNFTINSLLIGNLKMNAKGNKDLTKYTIYSYIEREGLNSIEVGGDIVTNSNKPQVDFDVIFKDFDLKPFSDLGGIVLSDLRGFVNGRVKVKGDYSSPNIDGELILNKAGLLIPYLNVDLKINEGSAVTLSKNEFRFNNTPIRDSKYNTKGNINGVISHTNFKKWNLDLDIDSKRLLVLNTTENDNELYYGTAFINGKANIVGPTDQLKITVDAASAQGTKFKIPISDTETIGDNSFIHFITPEEKESINKGEKVYFEEVKGLELQFDLDLNKYAEVEVVIDQESGSTLKGYGAGTLLIEINTNGKFNMWGDFVAYKGTYDFKYGGIVSKRFDVRTGNISWDGSPINATLDLSAVYKTNANPSIILDNSTQNRKIPVEVITSLKGQLLKPELDFTIEYPGTSSIIKSELDFVLSDKTTRERQAFSLITQGQFYSDALVGNSIITENLVETASDLISNIFSDEEDKFNIGFNYNQGDRGNLDNRISDEFGVSVSTQISKRILINGKVGIPIGGVTQSVVVGDVRIDFLLNEDGTLRATIFNRESDFQFLGEANQYTQGIGLSYSYDFNTFKELIRKILNKEKKEAKKEIGIKGQK